MNLQTMNLPNARDLLPAVRAQLNYLAPVHERPRTYAYDPPTGVARTTVVNDPREVVISDARPLSSKMSLDGEGVALVRHNSAVRNFYNDEEVKRVYYPEAERLLAELTGADRVHIFDHTVRRRVPGSEDRRGDAPRQPVARVHVDHTAKSAPQRVHDLLPGEADRLLRGRVQIINLWRPIRGPLRDAPLAFCDARTVRPEHLVPTDLIYPDRVGETYSLIFDPAHRWFYVPEMTVEDVLFLKCYDSETDGRARFTPHSAFLDPTTPTDAAPRESIELRSLVFHSA
jgi:hypothetical protein